MNSHYDYFLDANAIIQYLVKEDEAQCEATQQVTEHSR